MPAADWDPAQYLRFEDARLRPALDLLLRLPAGMPRRIVDLGCGAGNATRVIKQRYAQADVLGIDGSAAMLAAARTAAPDCRFEQADLDIWKPAPAADIIYSNAALHWVHDHHILFPRLLGGLAPGGWLAVQMPAMHDAPLRRMQQAVATSPPWRAALQGVVSAPPILEAGAYWDLLRPRSVTLDIWETTYLHALSGADAVAEWAAGSSLLPYLDALAPAQRPAFRADYARALRPHYPPRADGTTLLPFRRLFLLAQAPQ